MNKNTCLFVIQISQSRSFYAVYMGGPIFFYEEIYGMADFCIDGSIDDSLFNTQKKDTKDQAQINKQLQKEK